MPYLLLIITQTIAATVLFWTIFPLFQAIVTQAGRPQDPAASTIVVSAASTLVLQLAYWYRYGRVEMWVPLHSALMGHVLMFASRASFFFGAALFSAVFFRHIPQLEALPTLGMAIAKVLGFLFMLFSLFCYALELERLGRAIELP